MKVSLQKSTFLFSLLLSSINLIAQNGYRIEANIKNYTSGDAILANHYALSLYPKDTATVDSKGNMVFEGDKPLPGGIYEIVTPDRKFTVRLIIDKYQKFSVATDTINWVLNTKVVGNKDSELFYDFQRFMMNQDEEVKKLRIQNPKDIDKKLQAIQDVRKKYYDKYMKDNESTFSVKLMKTAADPEIPTAPLLANGKRDSLWLFHYYKNHFWDNFDFSDERLMRTPFLHQKLERYISDLTVQQEDSIMKSADFVVSKAIAGKNRDVLSYTIFFITNKYEQAKIVGTEGVFVRMAEKYYLTGIMPLSDTSSLKSVRERIAVLKPLLINKIIPDLGVLNDKNTMINIYDIKKDYTVLIFYSTSCGHCKEAAPKVKAFHDKWKNMGAEVFAITTEGTEEEWKQFIKEFKWENLVNGYGRTVTRTIDYRKDYDVFSTPTIYILDKNHKIIARRLGVDDLEPFLVLYKKQHENKNLSESK